jgi:5'(3')-deoxyribonucleotidase
MTKEEMWNHTKHIDPYFFERLKPMPDAFELISGVTDWCVENDYDPIILTGSPTEWAYGQKFRWYREYFPNLHVVICKSKEKHLFCLPGDILIDDRTKYKHLWLNAGGVFITHISAKQTLKELNNLTNPVALFPEFKNIKIIA